MPWPRLPALAHTWRGEDLDSYLTIPVDYGLEVLLCPNLP